MTKVKVATVWLGGCSGCHMSFLDLDERLIDLAALTPDFFANRFGFIRAQSHG